MLLSWWRLTSGSPAPRQQQIRTDSMSALLGTPAARWAIALTEIPSVTGTADEAGFAGRLVDLLRADPMFAGRPDDVWTIPVPGGPVPGGPAGRACVCAL